MVDEDSDSTDKSVSGAVKTVILTTILLALIIIFTRLISILMRSLYSYVFIFFNCGYLQNCKRMLRNLTFVVQLAYFCIGLNKGRQP